MNLIIVSKREGRARQLDLASPLTFILMGLLTLAILGGAFGAGMAFGQGSNRREAVGQLSQWSTVLADQKKEIAGARQHLQESVDAMAMRLGELDAHLIRLDALGKRLTEMAEIDSREFNFDRDPPTGGPEGNDAGMSAQIPDLSAMLKSLEDRVDLRGTQLSALENVILAQDLKAQIHPEGRPVTTGFISSYFGEREDPFTGRVGYHKGVDIAGSSGEDVLAVAAGVVTWAGERVGYGNLVEINHGDGFITRYAHNERALVTVGETVKRGDAIALMGSTGHSTGPHVHFEVLHNGRQVDPMSYLGR
jgi:murein DD-endopeptidase MepM/ murein hydrolase activator NlpD